MIRHIGITNHRLAVAHEAIDSGLYETLQFPFSYISGEQELKLVNKCKAANMGFIAMKAFPAGSSPTVPPPTPLRPSTTGCCPSGACSGKRSWTSSSPTSTTRPA